MKLKTIALATAAGLATMVAAQTACADGYAGMKLAELQAQIQQLQAQVNHMGSGSMPMAKGSGMMGGMAGMVSTNPMVSQIVNSDANATGQDIALLHAAANGQLHGLILGGTVQGDAFWAHSDKQTYSPGLGIDNQSIFNNPYLQSSYSMASNRSAVTLTNVKVSMIANLDSWVNAVVQLGDSYIGENLASINDSLITDELDDLNYKDGVLKSLNSLSSSLIITPSSIQYILFLTKI